MKKIRKITALLLAAVLIVAMAVPALAANGTISITPPDGATGTNTYPIYKVFDAVYDTESEGISYSVMSGKTGVPDVAAQMTSGYDAETTPHFILDSAGNVHFGTETTVDGKQVITDADANTQMSEAAIKAVAAYVAGDEPIATATSTGTEVAQANIPQDGYYYIATSTGTAVTITSFRPHAEVIDKNTVPSVDKKITGVDNTSASKTDNEADVNIGDTVTYSATVHVKKGAVNYVLHDKMSAGLTLQGNAPESIKINGVDVDEANYTIAHYGAAATAASGDVEVGDTITIRFDNDFIAGQIDKDIVVTYKAKINENAVIDGDGNPNTLDLEYGQNPNATSEDEKKEPSKRSEEDSTVVYTYAAALQKVDENKAPLAGATFQVPGLTVTKIADGEYKVTSYDSTSTAAGTTMTCDAQGQLVILGLSTESVLQATEVDTPTGYNQLAGTATITPVKTGEAITKSSKTIYYDADGNVTDEETETSYEKTTYNVELLKTAIVVVNQKGTELPSTGGMGTTMLYVIGAIIIAGAGVLLVTRRKMAANK